MYWQLTAMLYGIVGVVVGIPLLLNFLLAISGSDEEES